MFKDNIKIITDFFKLVTGSLFWKVQLFLASILGHLSSLLIPIFTSNIILGVTNGNSNNTYLNIILLAGTYIIYNLFWFWNYVAYSYNFKHSYRLLREKIIDKVFTYDTEFTNKITKGTILNTVNTDVSHLSEMIDQICEIIVVFIKVIVLIGIFFYTNIIIGFVVLLLEFLYLKSYDYCNIGAAKQLMGQQKYRDKLTDNLSQILNGLSEIKLFNLFDKMKHNFNVLADKWSDQYMKKRKYVNIRSSLLPLIIHFGKITLYLILCFLVLKGYYKINMLVLLISYFESIMGNTEDLMSYSGELRERAVSIKRIKTILNYSSKDTVRFGINENDYISGRVEFKNVSFAYKTKNEGQITKISFLAEPNKLTALVGHSGSGKTTIVNLLLRKYMIDKGTILIDDEDIYAYSKNIYYKNVIGVNQSPFIFNMSIRKNLSLIDLNFENQIEACKRVGIHDYIMSLPEQYNTILTENASNLSGGQRQLLSIARALLSKAEILIFDEVTSSLDPIITEKIKEIFDEIKQDHTIVIITHKKDVMAIADKIIVLNQGQMVGIGTHNELMKNNDYYIDLQTNNSFSSQKKNETSSVIETAEEK